MKKNNLPNKISIFPLSEAIFFPRTILPLNIFEDRYLQLINDCMKKIECLAWSNQKIIRACRQRFIVSDAWEK